MEPKKKNKNVPARNASASVAGGPVSELRRDLVTGNWIVVAHGRKDRPSVRPSRKDVDDPIETCPFEDLKASGNEEPVLIYPSASSGQVDGSDWSLQVIPNKYPAFAGGECGVIGKVGPYSIQDGKGFHEVIITRDHTKHIALLPIEKVEEIFRAYRERYLSLKTEECVKYISIFHNHGKRSGASLTHPHSQLIAIPILPSDIRRSLSGSSIFYRKHGKCVHCTMLDWEREDKKRIVFENKDYIAICPFISRNAYEMRIFPQEHSAYFEKITDEKLRALIEVFHEVLKKFYEKLDNPAYNFYLHTAPVDGTLSAPNSRAERDGGKYPQYHWHFEIIPNTETAAGFELSTGVEISTLEPEKAAAILRE